MDYLTNPYRYQSTLDYLLPITHPSWICQPILDYHLQPPRYPNPFWITYYPTILEIPIHLDYLTNPFGYQSTLDYLLPTYPDIPIRFGHQPTPPAPHPRYSTIPWFAYYLPILDTNPFWTTTYYHLEIFQSFLGILLPTHPGYPNPFGVPTPTTT